ncbi:protein NipSnap-like isoform X2 [Pomacea canaliculata]|uniref:protein NipSnap-like isoform X2 n=1 Tax=Pomacea canaliculata TaxID=400727 RepID=UPI000D734F67|nr:protein NipSnap-like isoform X2 [Pomacea canaliculata]
MGFDLRVLNTVMAAMAGLSRGMFRTINLLPASKGFPGLAASRWFSAQQETPTPKEGDQGEKKGWFQNILRVRTLEPSKESHSMQLSSKETVYEIQFHAVKPESMEEYLNQFGRFSELIEMKQTGAELVGSWTVEIGDQDEAIHVWSYKGGYPVLNRANQIYRTDKDFIDFRKNRNKMIRYRKNQILLAFSFWPELKPRDPSNIYELRSYTLKPGTMIEWGNNWARGIKSRTTNNEPVAGFFSQMGDLYTVHHFWAYSDLESRKVTREAAWQRPGWDECVAYTVPLIRHMQSRILIPTPFSPLK